ncbi:HD domain-containing protein [Luteolibacter pohnpeiensis]|uniref:HD domain-containing protein n=1 Tax=Luteolibacter pohnpeiensis TaxID=454153 RepID=A0A934S490_9BACT|nr:HD domain-containing protein [Luteolibacter pohnpeiensis]MBK1882206.1 HD domain-containing protein [Luteolibacter pohnpeiensis]
MPPATKSNDLPDKTASAAVTLQTALHIGASSVSMMVAEFREDHTLVPIDFLEQPAPLAHDIFKNGSVSAQTTERIVSIIKGYQRSLVELGYDGSDFTRAVASNILAEAANQDIVMNRIRIACGLRINTIDDGEMTRLIYLKTRRRLQDLPAMHDQNTLVVHVGPGNTRALLFQNGRISRYTSYRLGTHRTREAIDGSHSEGPGFIRVIREHASGNLGQLRFDYSDVEIEGLISIGYEIQSVAPSLTKSGKACSVKTLRQVTNEAASLTDVELVKRFQLDYQTAEALVPSLEINLAIAETLKLPDLQIPFSEYEHGLLHDLLVSQNLTGTFADEVVRSARILAARYQSDASHGEHVANLCAKFFNDLADLHQMTEHDALLLQVAAILHEVGTYISPRAHHKHSEYIILNSEIFGLDRLDITIVALVARHHRHSGPKPEHRSYAALCIDDRIRVSKLASLLRVADALERTHVQRVNQIELKREHGKLVIRLPGLADAAVERLAMDAKADLFEQTFGLAVVIEEDS